MPVDLTTRPALRSTAGLRLVTWERIGIGLVLLCACVLPFLVEQYRTFQLTLALIYTIAVFGLNMLMGYNGQISIGHSAFYALGAYTAAILMQHAGWPYWATLPAAAVICLVSGFLFGLPALRLHGHHLALATFALALATPQLLKYRALGYWTGGTQGIVLDKPDVPLGLPLNPDQWLYYFALAVTLVMVLLGWNLLRGRLGRAMIAVRDNPTAAAAMGINTAYLKTMTFGISALYTGVAGALSAVVVQFVAPDSFNFFFSITLLVGVAIGGFATISGAFYGALFIVFIPNLANQISQAAPWAIYGAFLIGFMYLTPTGVAGLVSLVAEKLRRHRRA